MLGKSALTALVVMFSGASSAQVVMDNSAYGIKEFIPDMFAIFLRYEVPDPYSTQIVALKKASNALICGQLNTKNNTGAYSGFRAFLADLDNGEIIIDADGTKLEGGPHDPRIAKVCKR